MRIEVESPTDIIDVISLPIVIKKSREITVIWV
jgi:hypothetical protein